MDTRKVLGIIFSILFVGAFTFVLCWGIINFNKVKDGMSGTGVYTEEDVNKAYQDGYDTALNNKAEYDELINGYRDTITTLNDHISQLTSQVTTLTKNNKDYETQVLKLTSQRDNLKIQVDNLSQIKDSNELVITELNKQIDNLEKEKLMLENSNYNYEQELAQKNTQIKNLQSSVSQLQKTNELNIESIANHNNQINMLNSQISDMSTQIQNNSANVSMLNNKISELEKSVAYYEQYIASLENGGQVVATFEFCGSVYNIQIVSPNSILSVTNPTSTDYAIFNYWMVNGERVDLDTYRITTNTKIVANVTNKYDVKFMVGDDEHENQIVIKNGFATTPSNPIKQGYEFDGWTINGVDIIDPTSIEITRNTTFVAKFTKLHTVTFIYEDKTYTNQSIRNNDCASDIVVDSTTYKLFNGWKLNGVLIDVEDYKILSDTTFIADITYYYDVKFIVEDSEFDSQIIIKDGYATLPNEPTKRGFEFVGWSINGTDVVNADEIKITNNTQFIALFEERVGFDTQVNDISAFVSPVIADNNMIDLQDFVVLSNESELMFLNKQTTTVESYEFVKTNRIYMIGEYIYANAYSGGSLYRFNIQTKKYEEFLNSQDFGFNRTSYDCPTYTYIYGDIVYIFGAKDSYGQSTDYRTYNLKTKEYSDIVHIYVGSSCKWISNAYSSIKVVDNLLYLPAYYATGSYSNYNVVCFDMAKNTYQIYHIPDNTVNRSIDMFEIIDGKLYFEFNNKVYIYNTIDNTTSEIDSVLCDYYSYNIVNVNNSFYICKNNKLGIVDISSNNIQYIEGCPFTKIEFITLVEDNKYLVVGTINSKRVCVYYWTEAK